MKLLIDIPQEFERHFEADRFAGSLQRLRADAHMLAGRYERETATMLILAFKHAVCVSPDMRLIDANALSKDLESRDWFDDADMHIAKCTVSNACTINAAALNAQRGGNHAHTIR